MSQRRAALAWLLLLLLGVTSGAALELLAGSTTGCPGGCRCSESRTRRAADCSGSSLTTVPTGLDVETSILDLSHNQLTALNNGTLQRRVPGLQKLVLSYNKIAEVESGAFSGLLQLWWLSLENNALHSLHPHTFQNTPKLWKLVLNGNPLHLPSDGAPFLVAPELRILELSDCSLSVLPADTFQGLTGLWTLRLKGNRIQTAESLQNFPDLEVLDLHENLVERLSFDSFTTAPKLKHLNVSSNPLSTPADRPFLNASHLSFLDLSLTNVMSISSNFFRGSPSITVLRIRKAKLDFIDPQAFSQLPLLERATLDGNRIRTLDPQTFSDNSQLLELDLSDNRLSVSTEHPLLESATLTRLEIGGNPVDSLGPATFRGLPALSVLDVGRCGLEEVQPGAFDPLEDLYELRLHGNRLSSLPADAFRRCQRLAEVNLRGNQLSQLSPFPAAPALERLDLGHNRLAGPLPALQGAPRLRRLLLDGNLLSSAAERDVAGALPALRQLDLRSNPWRCDCALRHLWRWCHAAEAARAPAVHTLGPRLDLAQDDSRCPEDVMCGRDQQQHWDVLGTLRCEGDPESAEAASGHDPNLDVEVINLSGRLTRP